RSPTGPLMPAIVLDGAPEPIRERNVRLPAEHPLDLAVVRVVVADVDDLPVRGKRHEAVASAAGHLEELLGEAAEAHGGARAQVEHLAIGRIARRRAQQRVDDVVDVVEVAQLLAVPEEADFLTVDREADEPRDEA